MPSPPVDVGEPVEPRVRDAGPPAGGRVDAVVDRVAPWVLPVLAAALAYALEGRGGPHLSPDSIQYVSVAHNLLHGHGFDTYEARPLLVWPPGYPLLIAAFGAAAREHLWGVAQVLGIVLAGLVGLLSWLLARRHLGPRTSLALVLVLLLAEGGPVSTSAALWVEPMLIASTLALVLLLERVGDRHGTDHRALVGAGLAGAAAGLASYGGDQVILAALLALLLMPAPDGRHRARRLLVFGAVAGAPNVAWMARNLALSGQLAGPRVPPTYTVRTLPGHLVDLVHLMFFHWCPSRVGTAAAVASWLALVALVGWAAVRAVRSAEARAELLSPLPVVTIVSTVLLFSSSVVVWVSFDARTLSRVVIPLAIVAVLFAQRAAAPVWERLGAVHRVAPAVAAVGVLVALGGLGLEQHRASSRPRTDYSAPAWAGKGPALRAAVTGARTVWSNQPDIVWKLTGRSTGLPPQQEVHFDPRSPAEQLRDFTAAIAQGDGVVIWFDGSSVPLQPAPGVLVPLAELRARFRFVARATGPGWTAWTLRPG